MNESIYLKNLLMGLLFNIIFFSMLKLFEKFFNVEKNEDFLEFKKIYFSKIEIFIVGIVTIIFSSIIFYPQIPNIATDNYIFKLITNNIHYIINFFKFWYSLYLVLCMYSICKDKMATNTTNKEYRKFLSNIYMKRAVMFSIIAKLIELFYFFLHQWVL